VEALHGVASVVQTSIIPDEKDLIQSALCQLADGGEVDVVFTPAAPAFHRVMSLPKRPWLWWKGWCRAFPKRCVWRACRRQTGLCCRALPPAFAAKTLIVNLPGSPKAAVECLEVFLPVMQHAVEILRGDAHECARKD
jgi:molybdopterin biosynthesis enzyme MoaB